MANQSASQSSELSRILLDVLFCNADKRLFSHKTCGVCYEADENKARVCTSYNKGGFVLLL